MTYENLEFSRHDAIALIRLSRLSDATHTLGPSFLRELRAAATQACDDPSVKLLVLTGKGKSFSAGTDLIEIRAYTAEEVHRFLRAGQALLRQIMDLAVITIAAVNGLALGGGLELALACDMRWAHARAAFGLPESHLGLIPGWGGMSLLRRTVPESLCVEMVAGGELITARRAYEAGLVSRIFEGRDFESAVLAEARQLAGKSKGVLKEIKALWRRERGAIDFAAADRSFLMLWNGRADLERMPFVDPAG